MKRPFSLLLCLALVFGLSWLWQLWYVFRIVPATLSVLVLFLIGILLLVNPGTPKPFLGSGLW